MVFYWWILPKSETPNQYPQNPVRISSFTQIFWMPILPQDCHDYRSFLATGGKMILWRDWKWQDCQCSSIIVTIFPAGGVTPKGVHRSVGKITPRGSIAESVGANWRRHINCSEEIHWWGTGLSITHLTKIDRRWRFNYSQIASLSSLKM